MPSAPTDRGASLADDDSRAVLAVSRYVLAKARNLALPIFMAIGEIEFGLPLLAANRDHTGQRRVMEEMKHEAVFLVAAFGGMDFMPWHVGAADRRCDRNHSSFRVDRQGIIVSESNG